MSTNPSRDSTYAPAHTHHHSLITDWLLIDCDWKGWKSNPLDFGWIFSVNVYKAHNLINVFVYNTTMTNKDSKGYI